jgi:hypothetical protein
MEAFNTGGSKDAQAPAPSAEIRHGCHQNRGAVGLSRTGQRSMCGGVTDGVVTVSAVLVRDVRCVQRVRR